MTPQDIECHIHVGARIAKQIGITSAPERSPLTSHLGVTHGERAQWSNTSELFLGVDWEWSHPNSRLMVVTPSAMIGLILGTPTDRSCMVGAGIPAESGNLIPKGWDGIDLYTGGYWQNVTFDYLPDEVRRLSNLVDLATDGLFSAYRQELIDARKEDAA